MKAKLNDLQSEINYLHPKELIYLNNLKFDRRKLSYVLGRISSKKAITVLYPSVLPSSIFIDIGIFNFPVIKSFLIQNLKISLSHSGDACIAIAFPEEHPIGVDLKLIGNDKLNGISSQLSDTEQKLMKSIILPFNTVLTALWTLKEYNTPRI